MKHRNARSGQRFGAYLLDSIITTVIISFIISLIPNYSKNLEIFLDRYFTFMNNGGGDSVFYHELFSSGVFVSGIYLAVSFFVMLIYYVIIPCFWNIQTLGRLASGTKVVALQNEENVSFGKLLLREIVGGWLVYNIFNIMIIYIITWILSVNNGRSLIDYIGGTRLIDLRHEVEEEPAFINPFSPNKDYVDATYKDVVVEEPGKDKPEENKDNSSDEYQVF